MSGNNGAIMNPSVPTAKVPSAIHKRGALGNGAEAAEWVEEFMVSFFRLAVSDTESLVNGTQTKDICHHFSGEPAQQFR
jgi:hypothetical protein